MPAGTAPLERRNVKPDSRVKPHPKLKRTAPCTEEDNNFSTLSYPVRTPWNFLQESWTRAYNPTCCEGLLQAAQKLFACSPPAVPGLARLRQHPTTREPDTTARGTLHCVHLPQQHNSFENDQGNIQHAADADVLAR